MRLIDADALHKEMCERMTRFRAIENRVVQITILQQQLLVMLQPWMPCRWCVYYGYDAYSDGVCNLSEGLPFPEDDSYCSFGLRQKEGIDNG